MSGGGSARFVVRFPALFHVTDRAALPEICLHGLLSAASLCRLHGRDPQSALRLNRRDWIELAPGTALRRQGMADAAMATRLRPGLDPAGWRAVINGKVFLFAAEKEAWRFHGCEPERDQVVLRFATAALLEAGLDLRSCRFNNGYVDRSPPDRRRLRGPEDYVPLAEWEGAKPREVSVEGGVPPSVTFSVLHPVA